MLQVGLYLGIPVLLTFLQARGKLGGFFNPVILAYAAGIISAQLPLGLDPKMAEVFVSVSVVFSITLLLFSSDFRTWLVQSRKVLIATFASFLSVCVVAFLGSFVFLGEHENSWKISGMLVGTYVGSLPNLAAIGTGLGVESSEMVKVQIYDILIGGLFSLVLLSPLIRKIYSFLPVYKQSEHSNTEASVQNWEPKWLVLVFLLAILTVGFSAWLSSLVEAQYGQLVAILGVSTLSIAASFFGRIRNTRGSYEAGEFFLLIFCVSIGSQIDLSRFSFEDGGLFFFTAWVVLGGILAHMFICKWFKIDQDTAIITMTASIYSPAFIGPVVSVLKNRAVILSGMAAGLAGLALGNYLGLAVAYLVRGLK